MPNKNKCVDSNADQSVRYVFSRILLNESMDWGFRIRKDVPSWVMKLVLIGAILLIAGLQYLNII